MSALRQPRTWEVWQIITAFLATGVCLCSGLAFLFIDNPFAGDETPVAASPSVSVSATSLPSGPPPAEGDQTQADQTQAFRDFAVLDTVRPPEWLALVTSVYRAEDGMMWAITRWPAGYVDRGRNVQAVCGVLSSFVLRTAGGEFSGVTVRAVDGSELVTRKVQRGLLRHLADETRFG